jgi:hypothetical protein
MPANSPTDLHPSEKAFHDLYVPAIEGRGNFSENLNVEALEAILTMPGIPDALRYVIIMVSERAKAQLAGRTSPSGKYLEAQSLLEDKGLRETRVIVRIVQKVKDASAHLQDLSESEGIPAMG